MFEIVFEKVSKVQSMHLMQYFIAVSKKIGRVKFEEKSILGSAGEFSLEIFNTVWDCPKDSAILINLWNCRMGSLFISNALLRLVKYGPACDVDLSFDVSSGSESELAIIIQELHQHILLLANKYKLEHFFGGLEPASDMDTRFFTDSKFGPLGAE